jgi:hypothetical protein
MRTKDPDVFDRVKRVHFDNGSKVVTTDNAYRHIVSFERSITSKMLAATSTLRSVLDTSVSRPVRIWDSSWWVVGTHLACLLPSSLRLGSVRTTATMFSLPSASELQRGLGYALPREAYQRRCRGGLLYSDPLLRHTGARQSVA